MDFSPDLCSEVRASPNRVFAYKLILLDPFQSICDTEPNGLAYTLPHGITKLVSGGPYCGDS